MRNFNTTPKFCPFQTIAETIHYTNVWTGGSEGFGSSTKLPDKDVTHTRLCYCEEKNCMAFDSKTQQCKRCK